ncbi:45357_t:CDS:2, partial [Gigaspora margarita]
TSQNALFEYKENSSENNLQTSDQELLNKIKNKQYNTCNKRFPSIELVGDESSRRLKDLTNVEKMLIAQVFPVISVYNLRREQYVYQGNIINFSKDLQEF